MSQKFFILKNILTFDPFLLLTPLLSRFIVSKFLLPHIPAKSVADQFAYRPTCSTTAYLVAVEKLRLEHHVSKYLKCAPCSLPFDRFFKGI